MGVPDAASAANGALQGQTESSPLKLLVLAPGGAQEGAGEAAGAPLGSPTWTDRDDRSGRTETTSAASDDEDEHEGSVSARLHAVENVNLQTEGGAEAARDFRELLRSMQCQLVFLQSMTQKIARDEKTHATACEPGARAEKGGAEVAGVAAALSLSSPRLSGRAQSLSAAREAASAAAGNAESERFHRRVLPPSAEARASPLDATSALELSSSPRSPARDVAPAGTSPKTCQSREVTCEQLSLTIVDAPPSAAEPEAESAIDLEAADQETRALQVEVQRLRTELEAAQHENARLMAVIQRLEAPGGVCDADFERAEDAGGSREGSSWQPEADPPQDLACDAPGQDEHARLELPDAITDSAMVAGNVFLDSASPRWLKGHEQCQQRTHELWETIRTLALYVRTYSLEKSAMRAQRDDATREAELAWAQNAALAGSCNPQQKIKYLQQLKTDNGALRKKIRELQTLLVEQSVSSVITASSGPPEASIEPSASSSSVIMAPTSPTASSSPAVDRRRSLSATALLVEADDRYERARNEVLRRMWRRQELLQTQLERLERQRGELLDASPPADAETARAMTSPRSPPRSFSGRSSPATSAALYTSSGARAKRKDARRPRAFDAPRAPIAHAPC